MSFMNKWSYFFLALKVCSECCSISHIETQGIVCFQSFSDEESCSTEEDSYGEETDTDASWETGSEETVSGSDTDTPNRERWVGNL